MEMEQKLSLKKKFFMFSFIVIFHFYRQYNTF